LINIKLFKFYDDRNRDNSKKIEKDKEKMKRTKRELSEEREREERGEIIQEQV
jgi:hypothetical protein